MRAGRAVAPCPPLRRLATAADALDLLVERRVFLVHGIVRVAQILLVRHVARTRLAMTDWRLRQRPGGRGAAGCRSLGAGLRDRCATEQDQERCGHNDLLHFVPPLPKPASPQLPLRSRADRDERRRNSPRYDSAFPMPHHAHLVRYFAPPTHNSAPPATCRR